MAFDPPSSVFAEFKHQNVYYSWEGEDVLIAKICRDFLNLHCGFFVDVGAFHPIFLSNTYLLYKLGWRGINIDATPGSMELFREMRPGDTNLELAVAREPGTRTFRLYNEPTLNALVQHAPETTSNHRFLRDVEVKCMPLTDILDSQKVSRRIDLLLVDAEGADLEVLESLDFRRYRPRLVVTEVLGCHDIDSVAQSPVSRLLRSKDYALFSRLHFSCVFMDRSLIPG